MGPHHLTVRCKVLNQPSLKKIILFVLVIPASLPWFWLCFLGLVVFGHAIFRDAGGFLLGVAAILGFVALIISVASVFQFPKVSKLTVYACGLGSGGLVASIIIGLAYEPIFLYSAISLLLASSLVIYEYIAPNKAIK